MAEDKEPKQDFFVEVVFLLAGLYLLMVIASRLAQYMTMYHLGTYQSIWDAIRAFFVSEVWPILKMVGILFSIVAVAGITYAYRKLLGVSKEEQELYGLKAVPLPAGAAYEQKKNEQWEQVVLHMNSVNSADWRLAIIEADVMLDNLLRASGYHGETTGDMLKAVEKSDFTTIEDAWEAHKIRNRIAHSGSSFPLNEREAKRTIVFYENVFKEFNII